MSAKKADESNKSLRELLDEFEQIVAWFDGDELDVEAAIAKYEEGVNLADEIRAKLKEAQNKIEIVQQKFSADSSETSNVDD